MSIQRVALIFDNTQRPETTGLYCRRALGALVEVEHFLPEEVSDIPRGEFDLFLQVDDGLSPPLPDDLKPSAYWAIDAHVDFDRAAANAAAVDLVFAAQRDGTLRLREQGIDAVWLPLACDPELHRPFDAEKRFDVAFVGNVLGGERQRLLQAIRRRYPNTFVGNRYYEQMTQVYSQSKIVFNHSVAHDVNMRVFEALSSGSILLTNCLADNGQTELFHDGVHLATYRGEEELFDKLDWYLKHELQLERVAQQGRSEVLSRHTYLHRMTRLLRIVERKLLGERVDEKSLVSPFGWYSGDLLPANSVSACLVSWKRPENMRRIVQQLRTQRLIDDILVWNNDPTSYLNLDGLEGVTVIESERNEVTYGRFLCMQRARHEIIYTQDDDCLVPNIRELYETFRLDPTRIAHNLKLGHLAANSDNLFGTAHMALVGWGAVLRREWTGVFDRYVDRFGKDELLRRKADRLFSILLNRRHRSLPIVVADLPGATGNEALSVRDDHLELTRKAVERALALLATSGPRKSKTTSKQRKRTEKPLRVVTVAKNGAYFEHARPDLLSRIPHDACKVLDVGCGAGRLGEALKSRQFCEVWGIERERAVAKAAKSRLDRVFTVDAETINGELKGTEFDCLVCGDVLEHLRRPQAFLSRARRWLSPKAHVVASLPNVRHHSVIRGLMGGNWTYESAGLLDEDHVRFFTRREIEKLFYRAGYVVEEIAVVPGTGYAEWEQAGRPRRVAVGGLSYQARDERDAEELFAYQYLVTAIAEPETDYGLTSIVIVTHNQLAYTHACVESIRHVTDEPYELIFVDNASTDGTPEYLKTIPGVTVVRNETNRGFPAAVNQGIAAARGEQILLLNNDTVVTTGWLRRMLGALHCDSAVGLVGPLSDNVSGEQRIAAAYDDPSGLDGFAWELGRAHAGQVRETDRLVGFCLLIRRAVIERIGAMDERFGIGNFEDDDFCRRAIQASFKAVIARDAFVHHVGGATFRASGVDFAALMEENRRKYEAKWNEGSRAEGRESRARESESETAAVASKALLGLRLAEFDFRPLALDPPPSSIRLSLCMIVRDNERTIRPALESIRPWVDEMIVVDTGSTDRTPDICRELGARVEFFEWCDDFSAARNESLKYARGEWIFWMDSDDTVPEDCGRKLRALADGEHKPNTLGYVMQVHCPRHDDPDDLTVVDHVKMFRNRPDLRFEHRIHEQILPAIRRSGGEVAFTDIYVVHSGSDQTPEGRKRKLERDYRLLQLDLRERPDHPFVLFNLGMTYDDDDRPEEAIQYLTRCLTVSQPGESHVRKAYALLVSAFSKTERFDEAEIMCRRGLELFPEDRELLFRRAMLSHHAGRLDEAETTYRRLLNGHAERCFQSIDAGITGYKARHNLAVVLDERGDAEQAERQWRMIVAERPNYRAGWSGLGECLLKQDRLNAADEVAAALCGCESGSLTSLGRIIKAKVARRRGADIEAASLLHSAVEESPDDPDPKHELARLCFETGTAAESEPLLRDLARLTPDDPSVWHNLGMLYLHSGRAKEAAMALRKSLQLRPRSPATEELLGAAMRSESGDMGEQTARRIADQDASSRNGR